MSEHQLKKETIMDILKKMNEIDKNQIVQEVRYNGKEMLIYINMQANRE